ncbi:14827_t:CDS:1, partial [Funneliformis geosporum]
MNRSAITVQIPTSFHNIIKGGNIPLYTVFPERYKEFAANLRKYSLLFLEQLSYSHGRSMLTFADLSVYQNSPHIGKIPAWFIKLQESLSNPITGELRQKVPHLKEYYFEFAKLNKILGKQSFI